jgi:hypothetical protein
MVNANVASIIDPDEDPEAKLQLLSGSINVVRCPNCGTPITMASPILYHDANSDLLVSFVPMELNMTRQQSEKAIGDLMRELTARIPNEQKRGYLFQPKEAFTLQGLIEMVLQADGITPEMLEEQKNRAKLAERFLQATDEELQALVEAHDAQLDAQFFSTLSMMAQRLLQDGRSDLADHVMHTQQAVMMLSSFGQTLIEKNQAQERLMAEVADDVQTLAQASDGSVGRDEFMQLALRYAGDADRLQALVGLARPAFDYQFFQDLTVRVNQAPAEDRDALGQLRDQLLQYTALVDQQTQLALQETVSFLRALLSSPDPDALIAANMQMLDDTFMAVLQANIQEAERAGDAGASEQLRALYERVLNALRQTMQPELRFINDVLSLPNDAEAREAVIAQAAQFGAPLLDMIDAVEQVLSSRGENAILGRLNVIRNAAESVLA